MRVFVTGAAGFIGSETTKELIAAGHQVIGLARSEENVRTLEQLGAQVHRGSLQDLDSLKRGAKDADGVIHLAFIHDFAKFAENGAIDKAAIEAMGEVLVGTNKPFIVTSGTGLVAANVVVTEDMRRESSAHVPRVSEQTGLAYASRGVRAMVIRLPQVHGAPGKAGLISYLVELARQKGRAAYVGAGAERWAAAHRSDVVRLYRLALEKGVADAIYHAVGEEGVPMREVIEAVGRALNVPVVSISKEEAGDYYGPLAMFAGLDMPASSALTQQRLGWTPEGIGLIADIGQPDYFKPSSRS
ncbi:SDR family oxidoreductase [Bradyrhizobium sp. SZCCHNRI1009]|uniref:SDR family oxidoreductase n=1 Tax=Bradyrhizobium sp. SZCCHNRI1009 TaxID=3057277 RepID=UPI002916615D|nr:SDR family oxidoreductase [Bradyrhizobium sp. SZCCHNRI1009]